MFYRYSLTVPANTPQSAPVEKTMILTHGIVRHVAIGFPPGCAALVHVSIFHHEHQLFPTNSDETFAWDDYNVVIRNEEYGLITMPYHLYLRAWSEDTVFSHTIVCRVGISTPEPHRPGSWVGRLLRGGWTD